MDNRSGASSPVLAMNGFMIFSLPASVLPLFLLFQLTSSSSSCRLFNDAFCSHLHQQNITLCPATVDSIITAWPPDLSDDRNTTYRPELPEMGSKEARHVRIWDSSLGRILGSLNYDFLYSFTSTELRRLGLRRQDQSIIDLTALQSLIRCNSTQQESFSKLFRLPPSLKYDVYYSILSADGLPSNRSLSGRCLDNQQDEDAVAWDLELNPDTDFFEGSCYSVSLLSLGYMHGRTFDTHCLSCQIAGNVHTTSPTGGSAICTCGTSSSGKGGKSKKTNHWKRDGSAITAAGILVIVLFYLIFGRRHSKLEETEESKKIEIFLDKYISPTLKRFTFLELRNITKSFREKLGEGGYAKVFKGKLTDGQLVAIKLLNESNATGQEFINEVACIGRINHTNVVSLLGFCLEAPKMALVYEFMPNGSLEKLLSNRSISSIDSLQWEDIYKIAIGIAKGLEYLHNGCNIGVVHFDIKPHNILLDANFNPKISDFGVSKLCPSKDSVLTMTIPRGTVGYIAPEVISRSFGVVSNKADIYSYGILILEMVRARYRKYVSTENSLTVTYFPEWIYEQFDIYGNLNIDVISSVGPDCEIENKMIKIGLWCIQTYPVSRPPISKVLQMLNEKAEEITIPPRPYVCSLSGSSKEWECSSSSLF